MEDVKRRVTSAQESLRSLQNIVRAGTYGGQPVTLDFVYQWLKTDVDYLGHVFDKPSKEGWKPFKDDE